jgi:Tfp pilus assembly protein PilZ
MLNIFTILIICFVIVYCSIILIKKVTCFRQQKKDPKERESEFMSKVYAEEQTTDDRMSKTEEKDSNISLNEVHSALLEKIKGLSEEKMRQLLQFLDEEHVPEKRKYDRKDFIRVIDYTVGNRYYRDFIQDMSEGGLFIETSNEFSVGKKILMSFVSPDYQKPFKMYGEIVHVQTAGIGVKFKIESQVQESVLKSYANMIQTDVANK